MRLTYLVCAAVLLAGRQDGAARAPIVRTRSVVGDQVIPGGPLVRSDSVGPETANAWTNVVAFSNVSRARHMPRFQNFRVELHPAGHPAPVDLASARGAHKFRTVLRLGARKGPNFADHFTVVTWGCGSPCVEVAVVDARTGAVYMPDKAFARPPMYRRDSRLLVVDPTGFARDTVGHPLFPVVKYYEWNGERLIGVDSLDASDVRVPIG